MGDGAGDTDLLIATLVGGVCDSDLRIALYDPDGNQVTDNGNGTVAGATQIQLTNPGSLVTEPGTYSVGVTCGGGEVGSRTPFEVFADAVEPPEPTDPPPDTEPIDAQPTLTG